MSKDLTLKQKRFLKEYFKTGNGTQSALKIYNTDDPRAASVIASENLTKLRNPVKQLMEARGLSLGKLLNVLDEGLEANKVISAMVVSNNGKGMKQANSMTRDFIDVPDHATRHKFLETAGKWLGIQEAPTNLTQINTGEMKIEFTNENKTK